MKNQKLIISVAVVAAVAVMALGLKLYAAEAKAKPAAKPTAVNVAKPAAKTKTLDEVLAFLPDPVAVINGKKISKKDFLKSLGNIPAEYLAQIPAETLKAQFKQQVDAMIDREVLLDIAEKNGIKPSKDLAQKEFQKQLNGLSKQQRDMLDKELAKQGKKVADLEKEILSHPETYEMAAIQKYIREKIQPKAKKSTADAEKFYRANIDKFQEKEKINVSHILVMPVQPGQPADPKKDAAAKAKINKILAQLNQGADFGAMAAKESDCPSKANQGNLGDIQRGMMVPEFEKAAFALTKNGQISGVVKTQYGYHIIKLNKKIPATVRSFDSVKGQLIEFLQQQEMQKLVRQEIDKAKKGMKIVVPAFK